MKQFLFVAALVCAAPVVHADPTVGPWEHVRTDEGITVHRRRVEGFDLHEFRGRGVIDAPMSKVLGVLSDSGRRPMWMERCIRAWNVEKISETSQVEYNRTKGTWPVSDRDVVVVGRTSFDVARREVRIDFRNTTSAKVPEQDGAVRIPYLRGHWILQPRSGGRATFIEYQAHADPAGSIPTFIVNLVSRTLPYKTLVGLREQVKRTQYPEIEQKLGQSPEYAAIMSMAAAPP